MLWVYLKPSKYGTEAFDTQYQRDSPNDYSKYDP